VLRERCDVIVGLCDRGVDFVSVAPSNTGVTAWKPSTLAAQPRWVSRICPTFIRLGTPSGLSRMSTGVPSSRNGMSSSGTIGR
jgi:hypothetical protein